MSAPFPVGLIGSLACSFLALACSTQNQTEESPINEGDTGTPAVEARALEIFSWWTAGGEFEGLFALQDIFEAAHPGVKVENAMVEGGAGVNLKTVLASRMAAGDPPDSFQVHAGEELVDSWVSEGALEPVTFIYEDEAWMAAYPKGLIDILSHDGEIWSVPVNIHRANVLWLSADVLSETGVTQPTDWDDFFELAETVSAAGYIPLALGDDVNGWPVTHLFESLLLSTLGPEGYRELWTPEGDWEGEGVAEALELLVRLLALTNADHRELTWDEAAGLVASGDAAATLMGDWAEAFFKSRGKEVGRDILWMPAPNSQGSFQMLSDAFVLPKGVKHRDNAISWLKLCGSAQGQDAFNPLKGSIPPRTDIELSLYDNYLTSALKDFSSDEIVPSLTHGAAANGLWVEQISKVLKDVVDNQEAGAQARLAQAFKDYAPAD